jgi:hypothetical protein
MHHEMIACDVVGRFSKDKRDWLIVAGLDGCNRAFNVCRAVIPSEQRWVFHLCFTHILPALYGPLLHLVHIGLTDGDKQEIDGFVGAIHSKVFPNAVNRECYYHHFVQKWPDVSKMAPTNNPVATVLTEHIRNWIKSMYFTLETKEEYEQSLANLYRYVEDHREILTPPYAAAINSFIKKRVEGDAVRVLQWRFNDVVSMDARTTNAGEVMHSSSRRGVHAVNSGMCLDDAGVNMMNKVKHRTKIWNERNVFELITNPKWSDSLCAEWLTDYCERLSVLLDTHSSLLRCVQISEFCWWVFLPKGSVPEETLTDGLSEEEAKKIAESVDPSLSPITKFFHVRVVQLVDGKFLHCDCYYSWRNKRPCIHIIKVLGCRHPSMYCVRWWLVYQYFYHKTIKNDVTDVLTPIFNKMMADEHRRTPQQQVYAKGVLHKLPKQEYYPCCYPCTTAEDREFADNLMKCKSLNKPVQRSMDGAPIWPEDVALSGMHDSPGDDSDEGFGYSMDDDDEGEGSYPTIGSLSNPMMQSAVSITDRASTIMGGVAQLTQEEQISQHQPIDSDTSDSRFGEMCKLSKHIFTKLCQTPDDERRMLQLLRDFESELTLKLKEDQQAEKQEDIGCPDMVMLAVAKNTSSNVKRKKGHNERRSRSKQTKK